MRNKPNKPDETSNDVVDRLSLIEEAFIGKMKKEHFQARKNILNFEKFLAKDYRRVKGKAGRGHRSSNGKVLRLYATNYRDAEVKSYIEIFYGASKATYVVTAFTPRTDHITSKPRAIPVDKKGYEHSHQVIMQTVTDAAEAHGKAVTGKKEQANMNDVEEALFGMKKKDYAPALKQFTTFIKRKGFKFVEKLETHEYIYALTRKNAKGRKYGALVYLYAKPGKHPQYSVGPAVMAEEEGHPYTKVGHQTNFVKIPMSEQQFSELKEKFDTRFKMALGQASGIVRKFKFDEISNMKPNDNTQFTAALTLVFRAAPKKLAAAVTTFVAEHGEEKIYKMIRTISKQEGLKKARKLNASSKLTAEEKNNRLLIMFAIAAADAGLQTFPARKLHFFLRTLNIRAGKKGLFDVWTSIKNIVIPVGDAKLATQGRYGMRRKHYERFFAGAVSARPKRKATPAQLEALQRGQNKMIPMHEAKDNPTTASNRGEKVIEKKHGLVVYEDTTMGKDEGNRYFVRFADDSSDSSSLEAAADNGEIATGNGYKKLNSTQVAWIYRMADHLNGEEASFEEEAGLKEFMNKVGVWVSKKFGGKHSNGSLRSMLSDRGMIIMMDIPNIPARGGHYFINLKKAKAGYYLTLKYDLGNNRVRTIASMPTGKPRKSGDGNNFEDYVQDAIEKIVKRAYKRQEEQRAFGPNDFKVHEKASVDVASAQFIDIAEYMETALKKKPGTFDAGLAKKVWSAFKGKARVSVSNVNKNTVHLVVYPKGSLTEDDALELFPDEISAATKMADVKDKKNGKIIGYNFKCTINKAEAAFEENSDFGMAAGLGIGAWLIGSMVRDLIDEMAAKTKIKGEFNKWFAYRKKSKKSPLYYRINSLSGKPHIHSITLATSPSHNARVIEDYRVNPQNPATSLANAVRNFAQRVKKFDREDKKRRSEASLAGVQARLDKINKLAK